MLSAWYGQRHAYVHRERYQPVRLWYRYPGVTGDSSGQVSQLTPGKIRPPDHPPLRHLMADNRDGHPYTTVPCPTLPYRAYVTADPIATALARPRWEIFKPVPPAADHPGHG